jgi:hypothetical protein
MEISVSFRSLSHDIMKSDIHLLDLVLELVEGGDLLDYILTRNGLREYQITFSPQFLCLSETLLPE